MKHLLLAITLTASAMASGHALAQAMSAPTPSPASTHSVAPPAGLYQALGEQAGIRLLMDDFVQRVRADARIGDQFKETNLDNLAKSLTEQLCQLSGGPCVYQGPDMKAAHANMDVTRHHFNALVEVLQHSMDASGIPFQRQNQMLTLLAPMHRDVVNTR